jgi:hypothetical protein
MLFKRISAILKTFAALSVKAIKKAYRDLGKNATGQTSASLRAETEFDTSGLLDIEIYGSKVFEYNEKGRPAGAKMPPPGSLDEWLRARGIPLSADFAIRKSIGEKGIAPVPVIETSMEEIRQIYRQNIVPKMIKSVNDYILREIKKGLKLPKK